MMIDSKGQLIEVEQVGYVTVARLAGDGLWDGSVRVTCGNVGTLGRATKLSIKVVIVNVIAGTVMMTAARTITRCQSGV